MASRPSAGGSPSSCCSAPFAWLCRTRAWMVCANDPQLRFSDAFGAWLAGDAMGNLTPLGVLASEPTKILMVRTKISTVTSIASVTIENVFYTASVLVVLLSGTWLFLQRANVPAGTRADFGDHRRRRRDCRRDRHLGGARAAGDPVAVCAARREDRRHAPTRPAEAMREVGVADLRGSAVADRPHRARRALGSCVSRRRGRRSVASSCDCSFRTSPLPKRSCSKAPGGSSPWRSSSCRTGSGSTKPAPAPSPSVLGLPPVTGVTLALVRRLRIIVLNAIGVGQR